MIQQAFASLKVLDCTETVAGAYCTKLLAELGAEVIKIERPGGNPFRQTGPFMGDEPHPEKSLVFFYLNTNKKSITLNLKVETGKRIFRKLAKGADVVVESFTSGTMRELGLSYGELKNLNPRLVMVSISGFGQTGPYRGFKFTNLTLSALGGIMYTMRPADKPEETPVVQGGMQAEYITGLLSFIATAAALIKRAHSGNGTWVDISAMECVASTLTGIAAEYPYIGLSRRTQPLPIHGYPGMYNYPCRDGWVNPTPGVGGAPAIAFLIGKPELQDTPIFTEPSTRMEEPKKFDELVMPYMRERSKWEITKEAQELRLAFAPILSPKELQDDEQLRVRDFFVTAEHPYMGRVTYPGLPVKSTEISQKSGRAPLLGEHSEEIYAQLGYSRKELCKLRELGVI